MLVLVDQDKEPAQAASFAPDGHYIPRTMVLSPEGILQPEFNSGWSDYLYFLPAEAPEPLWAILKKASK
ncbi:MAG: hypothetical protein ACRBB0_04550 [Pelagimonas sp.]|uniref:hypothetical protein n=1 Tax=Pelagimonas sp. TaxID=2073170 RepID=UPI003D6BF1E2